MLPQETVEKKKRCARNVISVETEDALIEWIKETPCLYSDEIRLWAKKAAEMDMTGEYFFFNF